METSKQNLLTALRTFARQRPGLEFGNYGDWKAYRAEMRSITRDLQHAQELLSAVAWRDSITTESIMLAAKHSFSGRLEITRDGDSFKLDYCTGQYFPTEYRRAVCSVLSSALWDYFRDNMPAPDGTIKKSSGVGTFRTEYETDSYGGLSAGDYLRRTARRELGRSIASRWFN